MRSMSLVRFIESRPTDQQILIVSKRQEALIFLDEALPETMQILSLSTGNDIDLLLEHDGRIDGVDGISIPEWTLTAQRIAELKARGYLIDAWTVNEVVRLVELTSLGVDAITTDNLAFFGMAVESSQAPGTSSN